MEPVAIKVEIDDFEEEKEPPNYSTSSTLKALIAKKVKDNERQLRAENKSNNPENEIQQTDEKKPEIKKRRGGRPKKSESEKKQKQTERARRFRAKNVNIGDQVERWAFVKCMTNTESNSDMAKILIDFYVQHHPGLAMIPGNPLSNTDQAGPNISDSTDSDNRELGLDCHRIKVEVSEGEIANDTVFDQEKSLSRLPDIKVEPDSDIIKVEVEDSDYNNALSFTPNSTAVSNCNHSNPEKCDESQEKIQIVQKRQGKNLQQKERTGNLKRKGLSDAISYLKVKRMGDIQ
ncbi:uncharacterized protein LOC132728884 [Ruditapes philippinarum]|uniref:uncharacterized protein LOC132728884 n=1 Tax=Ruditapes philippinarum TaxID=129788 RepID=UPI00295AA2E2|nr:uncharacterized protein LOC132728884 [Ruditapes philippinarum]